MVFIQSHTVNTGGLYTEAHLALNVGICGKLDNDSFLAEDIVVDDFSDPFCVH